jgi:hypothetical protein
MGSYKVSRIYAPASGLGVETLRNTGFSALNWSREGTDATTPLASNLMLAGAVAGAGLLAFIVAKSLKK